MDALGLACERLNDTIFSFMSLPVMFQEGRKSDFVLDEAASGIRYGTLNASPEIQQIIFNFTGGLSGFSLQDAGQISECFVQVESGVREWIHNNPAAKFNELLTNVKLSILASMILSYYFLDGPAGETANVDQLVGKWKTVFNSFLQTKVVIQAIQEEFGPKSIFKSIVASFHSKADRHHILTEINSMNSFFDEHTGITFPVMKNATEPVDWEQFKQEPLKAVNYAGSTRCMVASSNCVFTGHFQGFIVRHDFCDSILTGSPILCDRSDLPGVNCLLLYKGHVYAGCNDGNIHVFTIGWGDIPVGVLTGHATAVKGVVMCRSRLVSVSSDNTIKVWSPQSRTLLGEITPTNGGKFTSAMLVHKGLVFAGEVDVSAWDVATQQHQYTLASDRLGVLESLAVTNDEKLFASGKNSEKVVVVFDLLSKTVQSVIHFEGVFISPHPVRNRLYAHCGGGHIRVWDLTANREEESLFLTKVVGPQQSVNSHCQAFAGHKLLYTAGTSEDVEIKYL